jgi:hypothetical protein
MEKVLGLYTFRLHVSALKVYVTGDFDQWSRTQRLIQTSNGVFEREVVLPEFKRMHYLFFVDGEEMTDPSAMQELDSGGRITNVLTREQVLEGDSLGGYVRSSAYGYKRLDFDNYEIRILTLTTTPNQPESNDSKICCYIEHVSLINPGSYSALSYCWGDPRSTKTISLNGINVEITAKLYAALLQVQSLDARERFVEPIRLWVDAICINQADAEERSSQVRIMRQIYSRAKRVIAFIGEPCSLSSWSLYTPSSVAYVVKNQFSDVAPLNQDQPVDAWRANGSKILNMFFNEPYWTRVWVIQEIAVAASITMLYGDIEIPWSDLAGLLKLWKDSPNLVPFNTQAYKRALHLLEFRNRFLLNREPIKLLDALHWSYNTRATDSRDKIYALLGLCYDGQTYVPIPNYKQPLEAIVADMAKTMMSVNRSLDLICLKGTSISEKKSVGPTWLPNLFDLGPDSLTILESQILDRNYTHSFNPILEGSNGGRLLVKADKIGTVRVISTTMSRHDKVNDSTRTRSDWILETMTLADKDPMLANPTKSDLTTQDAIIKALTMSKLPESFTVEISRACFSVLWTPFGRGAVHNIELIRWIDENAWLKIENWTLREWSRLGHLSKSPSTKEPSVEQVALFTQTLDHVLGSGMRLVWASESCIGMAHPDAKSQDEIFSLRGCSVTVVLREGKDSVNKTVYRVIGGAYLKRRVNFLRLSGKNIEQDIIILV